MDMGLNGFLLYCGGIVVGIVCALCMNRGGRDYRQDITSEDLENLGKLFKEDN